jgi:hypothetical protein
VPLAATNVRFQLQGIFKDGGMSAIGTKADMQLAARNVRSWG